MDKDKKARRIIAHLLAVTGAGGTGAAFSSPLKLKIFFLIKNFKIKKISTFSKQNTPLPDDGSPLLPTQCG